MRSTLGVLDFKPAQYHAPLYRCVTALDDIDPDVQFPSDTARIVSFDAGNQLDVTWDIDLMCRYKDSFLADSAQEEAASRTQLFAPYSVDHVQFSQQPSRNRYDPLLAVGGRSMSGGDPAYRRGGLLR